MRRWLIPGILVGILLALLPLTAAAITDSQIISILGKVIEGVIDAGRDAYCAAGVSTLCP